jgi:hypothetical protein
MTAQQLTKLHYQPLHSNAGLNRDSALRCLKAGMTPQEIADEWPKVWRCIDGKLSQIYDSEFCDDRGNRTGRFETKYTVTKASVDKAIRQHTKRPVTA